MPLHMQLVTLKLLLDDYVGVHRLVVAMQPAAFDRVPSFELLLADDVRTRAPSGATMMRAEYMGRSAVLDLFASVGLLVKHLKARASPLAISGNQ